MKRLAVLVALGGLACSSTRSHLFGAHRYDLARDCLESAAAVDVIEGESPGTCAAVRCWISPGDEAYVTTTACDAPPGYRDATADGEDTLCGRALAAWESAGHGACPE